MARRLVVLTGAWGYVAQRMFAPLAERWDLFPSTCAPPPVMGARCRASWWRI